MAFDVYLDIPGVTGESTSKGMEGKIEVYSFSWGASNPSTIGSGAGGSGAGRVSLSSFNIMKKTEKSSPSLFQACCSGDHYDTATVTMRKAAGKEQLVFLVYEFTEFYVDSIQWSGSTGGDDSPSESVSFSYASVNTKYSPQKADGKMDTPIPAGWSVTTNAEI